MKLTTVQLHYVFVDQGDSSITLIADPHLRKIGGMDTLGAAGGVSVFNEQTLSIDGLIPILLQSRRVTTKLTISLFQNA